MKNVKRHVVANYNAEYASATRPGVLLICETWRDEAALAAHSASEPFVKNVAIINDCGEMKIEKFDM